MQPAAQMLLRGPALLARGLAARGSSVFTQASASASVQATGSSVEASGSAGPRSFASAAATFQKDSKGHILPHGGALVDLMVRDAQKRKSLIASATHTQECSDRNACDVELLSVGGFSPLTGFMNKDVYDNVVETMRLPGSNLLFGLPVVMDTNDETIKEGSKVLLKYKGQELGLLEVETKWEPNKVKEVLHCYKTSKLEHPGVKMVAWERGRFYIGGKVHGFELPKRVFPCKTPVEVRADLPPNTDVVVFQCRNPIHRAHYELFTRALHAPNVQKGAVCLVHPTCGPTQDDDIPGIVRYHTYEVLKKEVNNPQIKWAYLPYSMHMAGPREAIQHMLIRKNYGCTHFIVGRDMAGSKSCQTAEDFYGIYDALNEATKLSVDLGMQTVPSLDVVYTEEKGYVTAEEAKKEQLHVKKLSGTKFRAMLREGKDIPEWFAFKSVVKVLQDYMKGQATSA